MQRIINVVETIETAAKANSIGIKTACRRAGVHHSLFFRWKRSRPLLEENANKILAAIGEIAEEKAAAQSSENNA